MSKQKLPLLDQKSMSSELFSLMHGALVVEILRDTRGDPEQTNKNLNQIGFNMGVKLADDFLAKTPKASKCSYLAQTAEVIAKQALKSYLDISATVSFQSANVFILEFESNPLICGFVEIPPEFSGLKYSTIAAGAIRGALHAVNLDVETEVIADTPDPAVIKYTVALLDDVEKGTAVAFKQSTNVTPSWVNVLDEVNFELTKIRTRKQKLKESQQKHLQRPDFSEDSALAEQETIKDLTDDLTGVFTHTRRLIKVIEDSDREVFASSQHLKENVITTLLFELSAELTDFRQAQSAYMKKLDSRKKTVDLFSLATESQNPYETSFLSQEAQQQPDDQELTIDQIQAIIENEQYVKEREREVIKISKSILELNTLFKDLAQLVIDQGTILDRIDYNVEHSVMQIKSAHRSVQKAERSQRTRKMQCIVILACMNLFVLLLLGLRHF